LQLQSVEVDAELQKRSGQALEDLAQALGMESARELYVQHIHCFLDIVTTGCEGWSSSLPGKFVFHNFIRSSVDIVRTTFQLIPEPGYINNGNYHHLHLFSKPVIVLTVQAHLKPEVLAE